MTTRSFPEQLSDMWRTRPVRMPEQGHVAGVCTGIGMRYGVDPVLIRVAFTVSAIFGGAGIVLYLAAWVLFTRRGDQVSPLESLMGRGNSSDSSTKVIVILVALAIAASAVGPVGAGSGGSGFIGAFLMLGGWWLLYQRQPEPPAGFPLPEGGFTGRPVRISGAALPAGHLLARNVHAPDVHAERVHADGHLDSAPQRIGPRRPRLSDRHAGGDGRHDAGGNHADEHAVRHPESSQGTGPRGADEGLLAGCVGPAGMGSPRRRALRVGSSRTRTCP